MRLSWCRINQRVTVFYMLLPKIVLHTSSRVKPIRPIGRCRQAIVDPRRLRSSQAMSARMLLRPHQSPSELSLRQQLLKITIVSVYPSRHASPYTLSASLLSDRDSFHFGVPVSIIFRLHSTLTRRAALSVVSHAHYSTTCCVSAAPCLSQPMQSCYITYSAFISGSRDAHVTFVSNGKLLLLLH